MATKKQVEEVVTKVEEKPVRNVMSDKTRYIILGVASVALLALIIVLAIFAGDKKDNGVDKSKRNLSTQTLVDFYEQMDSEDLNVIYFMSATCSWCSLETPITETVSADYGMKYYKIDASTLTQVELDEIVDALSIEGATPTTAIVQNGKVIAKNERFLDGKVYVQFMKQYKILPDDATYSGESKIIDSNYTEFMTLAEDTKKDSLFLLDQNGDQPCVVARRILNELAEENGFVVNNLNSAYLTEDEFNSLVNDDLKRLGYDEAGYLKDESIGIPLLLVVGDGKVKDYIFQSITEDDYVKVLKKYGFIKK